MLTSKLVRAHSLTVAAMKSWVMYLSTASWIDSPIIPQMTLSTSRPSSTCWRMP